MTQINKCYYYVDFSILNVDQGSRMPFETHKDFITF